MKIYNRSLKAHGAGALYSIEIKFARFAIRLHLGGYGNIARRRGGCFTIIPWVTYYRGIATHVDFLNAGISFVPGNRGY